MSGVDGRPRPSTTTVVVWNTMRILLTIVGCSSYQLGVAPNPSALDLCVGAALIAASLVIDVHAFWRMFAAIALPAAERRAYERGVDEGYVNGLRYLAERLERDPRS